MSSANDYSAAAIGVKRGLAAVRHRPAMYIDSTDTKGIFHLAKEIVDNSIDEAMIGFCSEITMTIEEDGVVSVQDNGRGVPVDMHPVEQVCGAVLIFTELHAGGKFDTNNYKFAGGLHGVGSSVVNALSDYLELTVRRDGKIHFLRFNEGEPESPMPEILGECDEDDTGTTVRYKPTREIFDDAVREGGYELDEEALKKYLFVKACLNPNLKITLDYKGNKSVFVTDKGSVDLMNLPKLSENTAHLHGEPLLFKEDYTHKGKKLKVAAKDSETGKAQFETIEEEINTEVGMFFFNKYGTPHIRTFVNNIETEKHGKHLSGVRSALFNVVNTYAKTKLKEKKTFGAEDVLAGGHFVIMQKIQNAQFGGQTKSSLTSGKGETAAYDCVHEALSRYLDANPEFAAALVKKSVNAAISRERQEMARVEAEKDAISISTKLSGKLVGCRSTNLEDNELILVEGDSAGGSAKDGRCKLTQAILPLRGKILNTEKQTDIQKIIESDQIQMLYSAIGTSISHDYDYSKLRYGKVIIMTDADVDGSHIRTLLLTMFYRYMPDLIIKGHVYVAVPPLYKLEPKTGRGKSLYFKGDEDLKEAFPEGIPTTKYTLGRFKGLGEMNPDQLKETTLEKENRTLIKVQFDPEQKAAVDRTFDILMGKDIVARREFIEKNVDFSEAE
ncbi:toprim domain-containing protein [Vibrio crassostreae]|uniref:toprim domain-containing protein n=1 Tax=Vibrio crassostreae TaxID=246167 RepID=UPI001B31607A|nr:toprim domain-containing protein [Vibrio crassostreae]